MPSSLSIDPPAAAVEKHDSTRFLISTDGNEDLVYLRRLLRLMGIPLHSVENNKWWTAYNASMIVLLVCSVVLTIFKGIIEGHEFYSFIAIVMFGISSMLSYVIISWNTFSGCSILTLLRKVSSQESNGYGRQHSTNDFCPSESELEYMCNKWLFIACMIGIVSYSLLIINGVGDIKASSVTTWAVLNFTYIFFTIAWLLPLVLIRVSCHFMEKRILNFIVYVEHIADLRAARMEDMIAWYNDIYATNTLLSDCLSPLVTQLIVLLSPCVIFLIQGILWRSFSVAVFFAMSYWILANAFVLYVSSASAAQLDVANIRLEIAFAAVSSTLQFSSTQSISEYRLVLAKIRAVPFGINFFGLRKRIAYNDIWRITSIVGSAFIFILTV